MNILEFIEGFRFAQNVGGRLELTIIDGDGPWRLVAYWVGKVRTEKIFWREEFDAMQLDRVPMKKLGERFAYGARTTLEKYVCEEIGR